MLSAILTVEMKNPNEKEQSPILLSFIPQVFERILFIWAIRHPASGYVQGINDLVTPFFVVFLSEFVSKLLFHLQYIHLNDSSAFVSGFGFLVMVRLFCLVMVFCFYQIKASDSHTVKESNSSHHSCSYTNLEWSGSPLIHTGQQ